MLKVKINNEWIENVETLAWNEQTFRWEVSHLYGFTSGKIQDIKWVEDEPEEIEKLGYIIPDTCNYPGSNLFDMAEKLNQVIEAVNKLVKERA